MRTFILLTLIPSFLFASIVPLTNIDLRFDYLKLTKVGDPGKMYVESCNFKTKGKPKKLNIDSHEYTRRFVPRDPKGALECKPINENKKNSCYDFVPKSKGVDILSKDSNHAMLAGIVFFPFLFLGIADHNHYEFLAQVRRDVKNSFADQIYIGVNAENFDNLVFNSFKEDQYLKTADKFLYWNPFKMGWPYSESKFVRKVRRILNREFTKEMDKKDLNGKQLYAEDGSKLTQRILVYKADMTCPN